MSDAKPTRIDEAALVAHQIKSPIGTLQTVLRTLLGGFAGELSDRQRILLQSADRKCDEAMQTIRNLLDLADAVGRTGPETVADLTAAARAGCERYRGAAADKHLDFVTRVEPESAWVKALPSALEEAVAALIDNAVRYTPDHGRIVLRVAREADDRVGLRISDSGIGVPENEKDKLFQPFFRARNARTLIPSGTGLGLALVKAVVTAANGVVEMHRGELGGTEFRVRLPTVAAPTPAGATDAESPRFRVLVVGGVAAGPKIAARIMRLAPGADVTIIEQGRALSYAGCALPYYIGGRVRDQSQLLSTADGVLRGPEYFQRVKNVRVLQRTQALRIDRAAKRVLVHDLVDGQQRWLPYDRLALATGSLPIVPDIPGVDKENAFTLHGLEHAEGIRALVTQARAVDIAIVGGGLVGIEMTESLADAGCRVTLFERGPQLLRQWDWEMAEHVRRELGAQGVRTLLNTRVEAFEGERRIERIRTSRGLWPVDAVIMGVGVHPNSALAEAAGLALDEHGAIRVDEHLRTSDPDIFAAGDCIGCRDLVSGQAVYAPYGGTANRQGRIAAANICGGNEVFPGVLGTAICKVFDLNVGRSGLTEQRARELGYRPVTAWVDGVDRAHFMPQARRIIIKLVADAGSRRVLGIQVLGPGEVAKRLDVAVTAMTAGLTVDRIGNLDLGYAPSYATAMDNLHTAANVIQNKLEGRMTGISCADLKRRMENGSTPCLLDVRTHAEFEESRLDGSLHVPLPVLKARLHELPTDRDIVVVSHSAMIAYEASILLRAQGFGRVRVLDGGLMMWPYEKLESRVGNAAHTLWGAG